MRGSRSGAGAPVAKRSGRAAQCSRVLAPGVTAKLLTLARAAPSPQSSHAAAQLTMQSSGSAFVNGAGLKLQVVQGKRLHRAAVRPRSYTRCAYTQALSINLWAPLQGVEHRVVWMMMLANGRARGIARVRGGRVGAGSCHARQHAPPPRALGSSTVVHTATMAAQSPLSRVGAQRRWALVGVLARREVALTFSCTMLTAPLGARKARASRQRHVVSDLRRGVVAVADGRLARRVCVAPHALRFAPRMCGIIGIFKHEGNCNVELYEGLLMLQHRGQDSAGMVTTDWDKFKEYKENGLVKDVFGNQNLMDSMRGECLLLAGHQAADCAARRCVRGDERHPCAALLHPRRQHGHCARALPHGGQQQRAGGAALLCQLAARHLPHPQRQPDQLGRHAHHPQLVALLLQQVNTLPRNRRYEAALGPLCFLGEACLRS